MRIEQKSVIVIRRFWQKTARNGGGDCDGIAIYLLTQDETSPSFYPAP
jgi:hypothetical protein